MTDLAVNIIVGLLSFAVGGGFVGIVLNRFHDDEVCEITDRVRSQCDYARRVGFESGVAVGLKGKRSVDKQHARLSAQYRQLKAISNQRKELIEFMSQFLTHEELDRVHHEKRGPKPSTRVSEFKAMKVALDRLGNVVDEIKARNERVMPITKSIQSPGFVIEEDGA